MNYEKFIQEIKNMDQPGVSDNVWENIHRTIEQKRANVYFWRSPFVFPATALAGLAASFIIFFCVQQVQTLQTKQYLQLVSSTEYIYDICKYSNSAGTNFIE